MLLDGCEESLVLQNKAVLKNGELHIQKYISRSGVPWATPDATRRSNDIMEAEQSERGNVGFEQS